MDYFDMQKVLAVFLFLVSCTYSQRSTYRPPYVGRGLDVQNLDRKYQQKLINRIGFTPVFHNQSYMDRIRNSLPQPIARRINSRNAIHPTQAPPFVRELMVVGQHLPSCLTNMASGCFVLRISDNIRYLKEATLWIDLKVNQAFRGKTVSINEIRMIDGNPQLLARIGDTIRVPLTRAEDTQSVARDMTAIMKLWGKRASIMSNNVISRSIAIVCTDCGFTGDGPVLEDRVILEISMHPRTRRSKRGTRQNNYMNLCGRIPIHCCLQQYTLNFRRVGWDSWVVYPPEFTPNYCMGSCDGNVLPQTQHASMIAAAVRRMRNLSSRQRNSMLPCCAPTSMGSFTLMYLDPKGKVRLNQMNNLVAFDCGCM